MPNRNDVDLLPEDRKVVQPEPEKTLFSWKGAARPFKRRSREFYSTVGVIVLLLSVILFFAREFLLIGVIVSLAFIGYVLASVEPEEIVYKVTNKGIRVVDKYYFFEYMGRFWFEEKWGQRLLMIEHFGGFPTVVVAVLKEKSQEKGLMGILKEYLIFQKPAPTAMDNMAKWISEKIPLESS